VSGYPGSHVVIRKTDEHIPRDVKLDAAGRKSSLWPHTLVA
jgi:hypothetical protein